MAINAESVFVEVGAKIRRGDFNQALAAVEMFKATVGKAASAISGQFKKAFAGIDALSESTNRIQHLGEVLGVSNNTVRAFSSVAKMADVDVETFAKGMARMSMAAAKYGTKDGKAATEAFDALGISMKDANGQIKASPKLLQEIATKTSSMAAGKKLNVLSDIFGAKGAFAMAPVLAMGATQIADAMENATKRTDKFDDAMNRLDETNKAWKKSFSENGKLFGAFVGVSGQGATAVDGLRTAFMNLMHSKGVVELAESIGRAFTAAMNAASSFVNTLASFSEANPGLIKTAGLIAAIALSLQTIKSLGGLGKMGLGLMRGLSGAGGEAAGSALSSALSGAIGSGVAAKAFSQSGAQIAAQTASNLSPVMLRILEAGSKKSSSDALLDLIRAKPMTQIPAGEIMGPAFRATGPFQGALAGATTKLGAFASTLGVVGASAAAIGAQMWAMQAFFKWLGEKAGLGDIEAGKSARASKWAPDNWLAGLGVTTGTAEYEARPDIMRARQAESDAKAAKEKADAMRQAQANMAAMQSGLVPSSVTRGGGMQEIALPVGNDTYNITINAAPGMSSEALIAEMRKDIAGKQRAKMNDADAIAKLQNGMRAAVNAREE